MTKTSQSHVFLKSIGVVAIILAVAASVGLVVLGFANLPAEGIGSGALFTVKKGESAKTVAIALFQKGYIRSSLAFRFFAKAEGLGSALKAGTYRIVPGMSAKRLLDVFVSGDQALVRVTVPEGFTSSQIANLLERMGVTSRTSFITATHSARLLTELGITATSAEGYLFPDTYFFPSGYSADGVVYSMVKAFRDRLSSIPEAASLTSKELHDRIILASIVEREYKVPEEAPLMASVFFNRLKIRMALQSCATIVYVITERLGKPHPEVIYDRDLRLDDPYNSYEHSGLPPGPISNPGMTSLRSAFFPTNSRFLYFRLVDAYSGKHHFSMTLEEHLDASSLFIKKVND